MKRNVKKLLCIIVALAILPTLYIGVTAYGFLTTAITPDKAHNLMIPQGTPFTRVAQQLDKAGVISDARHFVLLARWEGKAAQVQAGEYLFTESATPKTVLLRMVAGDVRKIQITIPEGLNLNETALRVEHAGVGNAEQFLALVKDPAICQELKIPAETLEGYLFPETYTLQTTTTAEELVKAMIAQFNARLTPDILKAAKARNLNRHQLVILASIIQKEAGNDEEMPVISAVFHNRLKRGIPLQADPTVIYGIADFNGNITRKHLETPTPYNTYRKRGLPAGPIANPGDEALFAAAFPAEVKFLYFVAKGDGTHEFSATLTQHNRAVKRYQLRR